MAPWHATSSQHTVGSSSTVWKWLSSYGDNDLWMTTSAYCANFVRALPKFLKQSTLLGVICNIVLGGHDLVSSDALQNLISLDKLLAGSSQLQTFAYSYPDRNRVFGGAAHNDTINWIAETLETTGYYDVKLQSFKVLFSGGNASLALDGVEEPVGLFTYGVSGHVKAPVKVVSNLGCAITDFPEALNGSVALIERGICSFAIKATNARIAGAGAAIIYDSVKADLPLTGTMGGIGDYVPVVGITQASGKALVAASEHGPVIADMVVNAIMENRTTYNVIAETKSGDHDNVITLGAHSDSVEAGPGINDDGSGTIGILEVARALTNFKVNNAVRFCFWSAEEFGLLGSSYYVRQLNTSRTEIAKARAYLNFDMIASPNYVLGVYNGDGSAFNVSGPPGSAQLEAGFKHFFKRNGNHSVPSEFDGRSDYGPFLDVGIPSGGVDTGAEALKTEKEALLFGGEAGVAYDVNYHLVGDTIHNLNLGAYLLNTRAIADAVATYALSLDSIPVRNATSIAQDMGASQARKEARESRGRNRGYRHGHVADRPAW